MAPAPSPPEVSSSSLVLVLLGFGPHIRIDFKECQEYSQLSSWLACHKIHKDTVW